MQMMMSIAFSLLLAWSCGHYAKRRGRNPTTWFVAGAFFGILALIALFIFPVRKPNEKPIATQPIDKTPSLTATCPIQAQKLWYYLNDNKEQFGPMSFNALSKAWLDGSVQEQTFVWNEEMENWQPLKEVSTLLRS